MPKSAEDVALGKAHARLDLGLVARLARAGRQDADAVMRRHHAVAAVDLGIVERRLVDPGLQIIGHDQPGHAAQEPEQADMGPDPIGQRLGPGRLGIGVIRGPEHGDEDLGFAHHTRLGIDDPDLLARVIDEHLVAGGVVLAHHRRQAPLELPEQVAEPRVAVAIRMPVPVFLPQHHQIDAGPLQFARQGRPIRLRPPAESRPHPGAGEQPLLQHVVRQLGRQRPRQPGRRRPLEIVLNRAARHPQRAPDLAGTHPIAVKPQHLSNLPHRQLSLGRHPGPLVDRRGDLMPELLTRRETRPIHRRPGGRLQIGMVAGFISEWWPTSNRNGGRLRLGIPGRLQSESAFAALAIGAVVTALIFGQIATYPNLSPWFAALLSRRLTRPIGCSVRFGLRSMP